MTSDKKIDDAAENRLQGRGKGAFLLVNTLKLSLVLSLLPLAAGLVFGVRRLNLDFLGFACFVLIFSLIAGVGASLIEWQRMEKGQPGRD